MMFLDISKKPGDSDAVLTAKDILEENAKLKEENARLRQCNAAKLRAALVEILKSCRFWIEKGTIHQKTFNKYVDIITAAIAAPPRNCDRTFADHVAMYDEFKAWCNAKGHTMNPKLASDAFDWLLSKADGAE